MLDEVLIIDDLLSQEDQDEIKQAMFSSRPMWSIIEDVASGNYGSSKKTPGISTLLYSEKQNMSLNDDILKMVLKIPIESCKKIKVNASLIQARSFVHFPLREELRKKYDVIHVDIPQQHLVCLYYVNDSDGDTVLFSQTTNDVPLPKDTSCIFDESLFTEFKRVTPKKGRVVLFDGNRYHCSSGPTKDLRCVINFNLIFIPQ